MLGFLELERSSLYRLLPGDRGPDSLAPAAWFGENGTLLATHDDQPVELKPSL